MFVNCYAQMLLCVYRLSTIFVYCGGDALISRCHMLRAYYEWMCFTIINPILFSMHHVFICILGSTTSSFLPTVWVIVSSAYMSVSVCKWSQDQDQDSLLVKRRNDNHSPGPVIRELVPSSHQRSELSNTIFCIFSEWDQRIGEGIPIPDSLGEEATFINICIGNGSLKCHRVLIPTTPSFGDKVICSYTGFTFKTFI